MEKKKKNSNKQNQKKHYVCGIGDDGWGIHDVKGPQKTQKSGKK